MRLPNNTNASIDIRKLADYCLDPTHPVGRHKCLVFRNKLGLTANDVYYLRELIHHAALNNDAMLDRLDEFGQRYTVDFSVINDVGSAVVRSAWIIRTSEDFPRLTTCFVLNS